MPMLQAVRTPLKALRRPSLITQLSVVSRTSTLPMSSSVTPRSKELPDSEWQAILTPAQVSLN